MIPSTCACTLRIDGRPLTETWIYQWTPLSVKDRKGALT